MSLEYIRRTYGVPATRGQRIEFSGRQDGKPLLGEIRAASGAYLRVRFDGEERLYTLHPTWRVEYLKTPNGGVNAAEGRR